MLNNSWERTGFTGYVSHDIFLQFELTLAFSSLSFQLLVCMGVAERVGETGVALRVGETGVALRVGETGVAPA